MRASPSSALPGCRAAIRTIATAPTGPWSWASSRARKSQPPARRSGSPPAAREPLFEHRQLLDAEERFVVDEEHRRAEDAPRQRILHVATQELRRTTLGAGVFVGFPVEAGLPCAPRQYPEVADILAIGEICPVDGDGEPLRLLGVHLLRPGEQAPRLQRTGWSEFHRTFERNAVLPRIAARIAPDVVALER